MNLQLPLSIEDPMSFIMNRLPLKKFRSSHEASAWSARWPAVCIILHEMDYLFHDQTLPPPLDPCVKLVTWLSSY
ncbi:hypothetical protein G6F51_014748 [Rhizopus arrhizus]|uniref:Uncharacterized protein n=1 Tax=Rhizopus oryzae TaxID=64495 RepID=A0A9P6XL41_RHIOR|nr:hypothetical protein G6F51_014748 [Rhizopus arrhizus]